MKFATALLSAVAAVAEPNIVELAQSVDDLSTLVAAVVAGDLVETLSSPGPFTVFAPTNEGFGALPEGTLDTLLKPENKDQLVDILTYHVLPAEVLSTDLKFFQRANTVEGKPVHVYRTFKGVYVSPDGKDFKTVVGADNKASNGVAHIIDGVLLPPAGLEAAEPNIVELAQSVDDLSTLVAAVVAGDLVETLSSPGPFTVFAPTNEAFAALPDGTLDTLLKPENKDQLVDILTYHVLPAEVLSTDLKFFQRVNTVEGKPVHVYKTRKGVYVSPDGKDFKTVVGADNKASNGVAHIIDGVLLPPAGLAAAEPNIVELAQSVDDLSTLVAAVVAGDLVETLSSPGPFTVFAPTNEAFAALPEGTLDSLLKPENKDQLVDILTYHVLPAEVLSTDLKFFQRVNTVEGKPVHVYKTRKGVYVSPDGKDFKTVVGADNKASNGVAHIIDGVLLPPAGLAAAEPNIVELAQSVDDLSTLVAAVVAGDLVETLSSPGPFTVFAPTNEAFAALPEGTLDSLLKPENKDQLVDILTYHVLPAEVLSTDLKFFQRVNTVEGKPVHVYRTFKGVYVSPDGKDFKTVVGADNKASNGVAHIIDGVLLPPAGLEAAEPNIVELAQSVDDLSTLVAAVVAGDLVETLSSPGPFTVFAPTNEAFAALPEGTLDSLLKPENKDQLVDILTFHVLSGEVLSTDLKEKQKVATVEGKSLCVFKSAKKGVYVSPDCKKTFTKVVGADNKASNGVAHIIDGVLLPPAAEVIV